ncbi:inactive serine/threonine-protein kinase VRK3 [Elgaria multicarinata webbii]|uniref:inactive serine/threonine-protein kinase VRK3 n=1 Tax=Elgaria multicarinata webbii TaxID=159646 RepID=UPI002FCCC84A
MKRFGGGRKRSRLGAEEAAAATTTYTLASPGAGMVNFCPQCGQKVEAAFNFCPSCGGRLPLLEEEPMQITPTPSLKALNQESQDPLQRSPAKKKVEIISPSKEKAVVSFKQDPAQNSAATISSKAKAKPSPRSPKKDRIASVRPLPEGEILTDLNNQQWILRKLLSQSDHGLIYEAKSASGTCPQKQRCSLKLDAKDGRVFNEQNFLQRAAKKATVEKWKKLHSVPLLGIPDCIGFGLHDGSYRFLVFSDLGRSLQSILDDCANKMTEKAALQFAIRMLDVLEYLHENEYAHGDITAENIYVDPADLTAVTLANYCFAFRYSPGGKHVSQREGSRTPHEGTLEFISLDSHKGAAPSRRSDLESLGYCLVKWLCGFLPWSDEVTNPSAVMQSKERYKADVIKHPRLSFGWRTIPEALQSYLLQVMPLEYEERPDYEELRTVLRKPLEIMKSSAYDSVDLKVAP